MSSATPMVYHMPDHNLVLELCAQEGVIRAINSDTGAPLWTPSGVIYITPIALKHNHPVPPLAQRWYVETFFQRVYIILFERCDDTASPASVSSSNAEDVNQLDASTDANMRYHARILALEPHAQCRVAWFNDLNEDANALAAPALQELSLELLAQPHDQILLRYKLPETPTREFFFEAAVGLRLS